MALALKQIRLRRQVVDKVGRLPHKRGLLRRHGPAPNGGHVRGRWCKGRADGLAKEPVGAAPLNRRLGTAARVKAGALPAMVAVLRLPPKRKTTAALWFAFRGLPNAARLLILDAAVVLGRAKSAPPHPSSGIKEWGVKLVKLGRR